MHRHCAVIFITYGGCNQYIISAFGFLRKYHQRLLFGNIPKLLSVNRKSDYRIVSSTIQYTMVDVPISIQESNNIDTDRGYFIFLIENIATITSHIILQLDYMKSEALKHRIVKSSSFLRGSYSKQWFL